MNKLFSGNTGLNKISKERRKEEKKEIKKERKKQKQIERKKSVVYNEVKDKSPRM